MEICSECKCRVGGDIMKKGSVRTQVQFVVEITKSGKFGDDWKLGDIRRSCVRDAEDTLRKIIGCSPKDIRVIGKPILITFQHQEEL